MDRRLFCGHASVESPVLAAIAVLPLLACGCGKTGPEPVAGSGKITVTIWDWHAADPSKGIGLWLTRIDREFEQRHPNIRIKHVGQSHTEYYEILKAAEAARRGPDVIMLHQGMRVMDHRDNLLPLTEFITPDFRQKLVGWEHSSEGYDPNGTPWAVPIAVQGTIWYYNKALLRQAGLDPARPPATWAEFLAACEAVKRIGKAGIAVGQKEGDWADWFTNSANSQTFGPGDADRFYRGQIKWTDPRMVAIITRLKELNDRGCFQKGAMSTPLFPDASEVFMRGEAAFFLGLTSDVAHWKEFGDMMGPQNIGVMTCPIFQPGPDADKFPTGGGFAYGITRWSKCPKEAFEYIAFIANEENARTFLTEVGSFPANQRYDKKLITDPNAKTITAFLAAGRGGCELTTRAPRAVYDAFRRECQRVLTGQTDIAGALAAVEKVAQAERGSADRPAGVPSK
jgi:ABC-type glycerol-3-phosphate transport system substrate-binding protein